MQGLTYFDLICWDRVACKIIFNIWENRPLLSSKVIHTSDVNNICGHQFGILLTILCCLTMLLTLSICLQATNPYLTSMPQVGGTFSPYFTHAGPIMPTAIMGPDPAGVTSPLGMVQQTVVTQQKMPRSDRLEVSLYPFL